MPTTPELYLTLCNRPRFRSDHTWRGSWRLVVVDVVVGWGCWRPSPSPPDQALFHIANEFAIRHQRSHQHSDYDPALLDWIF
jgi:hypothetical protein